MDQPAKRPSLFPLGDPLPAQFSAYFEGQAFLRTLTSSGVKTINVTFAPGCRNHWHMHHKGGQILLVTEGSGWYQAWGEAPQKLLPGDVVNIPPECKHWHGAAKDSWFAHIAIEVPVPNGSVEWLEPVASYDELPA